MNVGINIREQRVKRGLTQEALAEQAGVSRQAVAKWESGETLPELDRLLFLSRYFALPLDVLVKGEEILFRGESVYECLYHGGAVN
jgi:transcriptional regulator with XRE-family HTH domain